MSDASYVWKLVRGNPKKGEKMTSCVIDRGAYQLTYRMRRRTFAAPNSIGILVFTAPYWARRFRCNCFNGGVLTILKCRYTGIARIPKVFIEPLDLKNCYRTLTLRWLVRKYSSNYYGDSFPGGTLAVDAITPVAIEEVYDRRDD